MSNDDALRSMRHDLRHALYVLDLGFSLLEESRADDERFAEVLDTLRREQQTIGCLVDKLLVHVQADAADGPGASGPQDSDEEQGPEAAED